MGLAGRVEQPPASIKIGFENSVEICRNEAVRVAADEARGYPKSPAECNCEMRKIAANACPLEKGFVGGRLFRAGIRADIPSDRKSSCKLRSRVCGPEAMTQTRRARMQLSDRRVRTG